MKWFPKTQEASQEGGSMFQRNRIRGAGRQTGAAAILAAVLLNAAISQAQQRDELSVVASLTIYRDIAREIVGERGEVASIAEPRQDAHFVQAKPSYSMMLSRADLLVETGLDLELWLPAVIDKSRNPDIREGQEGYVSVSTGVPMLQIPENPSRAGGDIHIFGNPHVHTDPLRAVMIANNVKIGLQKVDPQSSAYYENQFQSFKRRIHERLFGAELVGLVGGDKLAELALAHQLLPFLESNQMGGQPLMVTLGGWMNEAQCLRGKVIVAYHLNWIYFTDRFGIQIANYVERRPGIPPSAAHVADLIAQMRQEEIGVIWVADYFDERIPELLSERTGAKFLYVPLYTGGPEVGSDYFALVDNWIQAMRSGFPDCQ